MKYRKFGKTDWNVSSIGCGTWAMGSDWGSQNDADSIKAIHKAIDLGCNFIDTARAYGGGKSERIISSVLKERSGERIYLASKIPPFMPGDWPPSPYDSMNDRYPEEHIRSELEKSLRDLDINCIDLMQIHTWSRAWNRDPKPFEVLRACQQEGKIRFIGVSTPEHDQEAVVDLMRNGWVDSVQVIYNIFNQEAQSEIFPIASEHQIAVIVRVAFDEGALTGKLTAQSTFTEGDMRQNYFAGDRLERTVNRVEEIRKTVGTEEPDLAASSLKFVLKPECVSTVIPGIRNERQAELNCAVGSAEPMSDSLEEKLRGHYWRRNFWYSGK